MQVKKTWALMEKNNGNSLTKTGEPVLDEKAGSS